ncbi:MAG: c-type cytochrome [Campylobacter sputorum]|uniref:c-type cytochrome n=1 Tax=Campylobacter sputorum TaxID=206 RepID=UPI000B79AC60|nr:c-type cytochrome [Campylobacter sputorum]ASM36397.1 periplasmic monoheme cytochrome c553 [Campylobacter sputorum bv. faecalis CCUG 20703]ASM38082.1 periplasmic monoheme cytochrome c553 [Campylobacter sputorum bv. paraureolyticus LMG 11764]MDY6121229.1 c-type cytochrome [Campylobacter sputorum]
MKKLVIATMLACFTAGSVFGADGATIFKKCAVCHGAKAEKSYLNKVPVLTTIEPEKRLENMKGYKAGTIGDGKGLFGMGLVMKGQMATLSEEDMKAVNDYISTLK